ncbi:SusC/RagA family TonB-linked outer membrane protein [Natronoflexus pectinivorans]|uniref:Iron complex outermembrane receptor protein n=1 Tax=Natronoflexus pectinivorans TaxID=682526 RepID=A0A4R2GGI4_9BACT|nr:TonB-dependent receptor [Natronoflexus pectinivorans]TCO07201.1 iron complex outermembrane receptor protein [Natronoflexus pectinivorans]
MKQSRRIKLKWLGLLFLLWGVVSPAISQQRTVTGLVVDSQTGESIPGATVIVQGTQRGTVSSTDGDFSILAANEDVLRISYIGYESRYVGVGERTHLIIELDMETFSFDEVVVIGYGQVRRDDATGSLVSVSSRDFNRGAITSPQELIAGRVSGVQITSAGGAPGSGSAIRIRGGSSLSASNEPLIVIDGVPVDNDGVSGMRNPLSTINPSDIESFTVLKDASATAIYGSRASNGVIIITTRSGQHGKIRFNYDANVSVGIKTNQIEVFNAEEYRQIIYDRFGENSNAANLLGNSSTNWQDEIFQTAIGHDHNFSMSGAYMDVPYRFSVGYSDQSGLLKTSDMKRYTASMNLTPTFFDDHLKVTLSLRGMFNENRFATTGAIGNAILYDPTKPVFDESSPYGGYTTWMDGDRPASFSPVNPVAQLNQRDDTSEVFRSIGSAKFDYRFHFLPELVATLNLGYDYSNTDGTVVIPENAAFAYRRAADGTDISGEHRVYTQDRKNQLLDFYLNYNRDLPTIQSRIDLMGGYSWQHFWREDYVHATSINRQYLIAPERTIPTENYLVSFFGRMNYSLMERYLLTLTVRHDGTSRFSKDNRFGTFPSLAAAWRINQESFLQNSAVVSNLRLRLGYGVTGQQYITSDNYPYLARYSLSQSTARYRFGDDWVTMARPSGYDANLRWEETTTYNVGVDFGFFNERINGSIELYHRETTDLINEIPVAAGTNFTNILLTNVGSLENRGVEFNLNLRPVITSDLFWETGFNFTYNKNEITKLTVVDDPGYQGAYTGVISGGTGNYAKIHSVGKPANSFFVYQQVYDENKMPIAGLYGDRNGDGEITIDDRYHFHSSAPKFLLGLSSRVEYKDWDFSFAGRASIGNFVYNDFAASNANYRYTYSNTYIQNLPKSVLDTNFESQELLSDFYVRDASFFRMDNISLGYRFANLINQNSSLRLSFTVQNVFVITDYEGLDPEVFDGMDINVYPRPTTFLLGVNLEF